MAAQRMWVYRALVCLVVVVAALPFVLPAEVMGPASAGSDPEGMIAVLGLFAALALWWILPFAIFPVAPMTLCRNEGDVVRATVLPGERWLSLRNLRAVGAVKVYLRSGSMNIVLLRDSRNRRLILTDSSRWLPPGARTIIAIGERPRVSISARARWRLGIHPLPSRAQRVGNAVVTCAVLALWAAASLGVMAVYWSILVAAST